MLWFCSAVVNCKQKREESRDVVAHVEFRRKYGVEAALAEVLRVLTGRQSGVGGGNRGAARRSLD